MNDKDNKFVHFEFECPFSIHENDFLLVDSQWQRIWMTMLISFGPPKRFILSARICCSLACHHSSYLFLSIFYHWSGFKAKGLFQTMTSIYFQKWNFRFFFLFWSAVNRFEGIVHNHHGFTSTWTTIDMLHRYLISS